MLYRRPKYDRKLSRTLILADGRRLVTIRAAGQVLSELQGPSQTPSGTLGHAIGLMLTAGLSGAPKDIEALTDEVERLLRDRQLLNVFQRSRRARAYDRKLSRPLILADGRRLVTVRAAAHVLSELHDMPQTPAGALDHAMGLLTAGMSGAPEDIAALTDEVERLLRDRQLLA